MKRIPKTPLILSVVGLVLLLAGDLYRSFGFLVCVLGCVLLLWAWLLGLRYVSRIGSTKTKRIVKIVKIITFTALFAFLVSFIWVEGLILANDGGTENPGWVCLEATFRLTSGDKEAILAEMADYAQRRRDKQPLEWPSAGSTFKRPEGHFAGKLIEDTGLKGFTVGGAQVSEKHAGFVINKGGATCADVLSLMEQVSDIVYEKFGVRLEPEVKILK